jgi:hypothetical protein
VLHGRFYVLFPLLVLDSEHIGPKDSAAATEIWIQNPRNATFGLEKLLPLLLLSVGESVFVDAQWKTRRFGTLFGRLGLVISSRHSPPVLRVKRLVAAAARHELVTAEWTSLLIATALVELALESAAVVANDALRIT